jgi:hypothetical protein
VQFTLPPKATQLSSLIDGTYILHSAFGRSTFGGGGRRRGQDVAFDFLGSTTKRVGAERVRRHALLNAPPNTERRKPLSLDGANSSSPFHSPGHSISGAIFRHLALRLSPNIILSCRKSINKRTGFA